MALDTRQVKALEPAGGVRYYHDGEGLYLKVSRRGTKTWFLRHKGAWIHLGRYPELSLLEARNKAAERKALGPQAVRTVAEAWQTYLPHLRRTYESYDEIERRAEKDIITPLGPRRLAQVSRADIAGALQLVVDRGSLVLANRLLSDVKHFFRWCHEKGWLAADPTSLISRRSVGGREVAKKRALTTTELSILIGELMGGRFELKTRLALGLILLTGQRPSEVLGVHMTEIVNSMWVIPAQRTKPRRAHKVYLSPQARRLFSIANEQFGERPFKGFNHRTLSKAVSRLGWEDRFTPQDLRRTMATRLAELRVPPHVVEKMLNHQMEGVWAVYNRAEYLPERREAWRLWGRELAKLRRKRHATHPALPAPSSVRGTGVHANDAPGSGV